MPSEFGSSDGVLGEGPRMLKYDLHTDARGSFRRVLNVMESPLEAKILQVNASVSTVVGTVRGLHFQIDPMQEEKTVACIAGEIFDVVVDIRPRSSTFGEWRGFSLDGKTATSIHVPKGFAHGFQVLQAPAVVVYAVTAPHSARHERAISATDPEIGISWPLPISLTSDRDRSAPTLREATIAMGT